MSGEPATPAAPSLRCVVFRAGGERFALPLAAVRAVVLPQPPFARVPRSGPAVKGAMNLRGRIVPVVDLARLLGVATPEPLGDREGQVLVLEGERPGLGLLVSAVLGVEALGGDPGSSASEPVQIASCQAGAVTLLDADELASSAAAQFGSR